MKPETTLRHSLILAPAFFALLAMTAVSSAQNTDATLSGLVPSAGTLAQPLTAAPPVTPPRCHTRPPTLP